MVVVIRGKSSKSVKKKLKERENGGKTFEFEIKEIIEVILETES